MYEEVAAISATEKIELKRMCKIDGPVQTIKFKANKVVFLYN